MYELIKLITKHTFILVLKKIFSAYRYIISPFFGDVCRFTPSCSFYAEEAFRRHGILKGIVLIIYRLGRCHPWCQGGVDPVPDTFRFFSFKSKSKG